MCCLSKIEDYLEISRSTKQRKTFVLLDDGGNLLKWAAPRFVGLVGPTEHARNVERAKNKN